MAWDCICVCIFKYLYCTIGVHVVRTSKVIPWLLSMISWFTTVKKLRYMERYTCRNIFSRSPIPHKSLTTRWIGKKRPLYGKLTKQLGLNEWVCNGFVFVCLFALLLFTVCFFVSLLFLFFWFLFLYLVTLRLFHTNKLENIVTRLIIPVAIILEINEISH